MTFEHPPEHALTSNMRSNVSNIFLENSFEAVLVTNAVGEIIYSNPAVSRNFGYHLAELEGKSIFEIFTVGEEDKNKLLNVCDQERSTDSENTLPGLICSSEGINFDVQLRSFPTEVSAQRQLVFLVRDISTRMSIRRELETSQQLMGSIVEGVGDAIFATDSHGKLTLFNKGAEDVFGYQAEEVLGQNLYSLIPEEHRLKQYKNLSKFEHGPANTLSMGVRESISGLRKNG